MADQPKIITRREFLGHCCRGAGLLVAGGLLGTWVSRSSADGMVWQLDPDKCSQCGKCATACVLSPSAVKVVHETSRCGYCELCFGYYLDQRPDDQEAAENQRCPTNALIRHFVEEPYHQYTVDEAKCIGCGLCVKGCQAFGNGSLILQARHDRCLNCNQCSIATICPAQAWRRVPATEPYLLRGRKDKAEEQPAPGGESAPPPGAPPGMPI
jgi:electron transport complex protein RnfB